MPVGLVRKWTLVALLGAAVAVTACKDDDDPETKPVDSGSPGGGMTGGNDAGSPGGGGDSGSPGGGGGDSGSPGGGDAAAAVMCGGATCTDHVAGGVLTFKAGCATSATDASVCGISTSMLGTDSGLPPFLEKNAPGVASPSCAAFVDGREPPATMDGGVNEAGVPLLGPGNGRIDTNVTVGGTPLSITYPGCCTPLGYCSGNTDEGLLLGAMPSMGGFGCMTHTAFFRQIDGGLALPCNPTTGALMLPSGDAGSDSGGGDSGDGDAGTDDAGDGG